MRVLRVSHQKYVGTFFVCECNDFIKELTSNSLTSMLSLHRQHDNAKW